MRQYKKIISIILMFSLVFSSVAFGATIETSVEMESGYEQVGNTREFKVTHNLTVSGQKHEIKSPDVVIALDRSGSMLWYHSGERVVNYVKPAVSQFISSYFLSNPSGKIAFVAFGSKGTEIYSGQYYNNASDAISLLNKIYAVKNGGWKYTINENGSSIGNGTNVQDGFYEAGTIVKNNGNDQDVVILFSDGVANMYYNSSGYLKSSTSSPTSVNASGIKYAIAAGKELQKYADVMTVGYFGGYNSKPTTQTVANAMLEQSQNAGFFTTNNVNEIDDLFGEVLSNLEYIGTEVEITDVINEEFVVDESSVSPSNYELREGPEPGQTTIVWKMETLKLGEYDFTYNIKPKVDAYPSGKDSVNVNHLTADLSNMNLNTTVSPGISFVNLEGQTEQYDIEQITVNVPEHDTLPEVTVTESYDNLSTTNVETSVNGFLVGDTVRVTQEYNYTNTVMIDDPNDDSSSMVPVIFDIETLDPGIYKRTLQDGKVMNDNLLLGEDNSDSATTIVGLMDKTIETTYEDVTVGSHDAGSNTFTPTDWNDVYTFDLTMEEEGTFDFAKYRTYTLYNPYSKSHNFTYSPALGTDKETYDVKSGTFTLELMGSNTAGNYVVPLNEANLVIIDRAKDVTVNTFDDKGITATDGLYTIDDMVTGDYEVILEVPDGYQLPEDHTFLLTTNEDGDYYYEGVAPNQIILPDSLIGDLVQPHELSYDNPLIDLGTIEFDRLDIANLAITTEDGESSILTNMNTGMTVLNVTFRPMIDISFLALPIFDNYDGADDIKDPADVADGIINIWDSYVDQDDYEVIVTAEGSEEEIKGFRVTSNNALVYDFENEGAVPKLDADTLYTAKIVVKSLPAGIKLQEDSFDLSIKISDVMITRASDSVSYNPVASVQELRYNVDEIAPVITWVTDPEQGEFTESNVNVAVSIVSTFSSLVDYKMALNDGTNDVESFTTGQGFDSDVTESLATMLGLEDQLTSVQLTLVAKSNPSDTPDMDNGVYIGNGAFVVYAEDAAGNKTTENYVISNILLQADFNGLY